MKYLLCFLLLLPTILLAESQTIFFDSDLFYNGIVRKQYKNVLGIFEGGAGLGFEYKDNPYYAALNFDLGFSLNGGAEKKELEYKGNINAEFSYFFQPLWEPFIILQNEYDTLAKLHWRNYTGTGLKILAYENEKVMLKFFLASVLHYEKYLPDKEFNKDVYERVTISHIFGGIVSYSFYTILTITAQWYIIPLYNFSECRVLSELSLTVMLFREDFDDRKSGGDFVIKFANDHYTHPKTYRKDTDFIMTSGFKFYL